MSGNERGTRSPVKGGVGVEDTDQGAGRSQKWEGGEDQIHHPNERGKCPNHGKKASWKLGVLRKIRPMVILFITE